MADFFIEVKTKNLQLLYEELGIPEGEVWVEYPEYGIEIRAEATIIRTAEWEAIVSLAISFIGATPPIAAGVKLLYGKLKKSQVADEVEILKREKAQLTEALIAEVLKAAREGDQSRAISAPAPSAPPNPTIPDQIQQLAVLHATGALTDEEFAAKKAELLARM